MKKTGTIDEYILEFPKETQKILRKIRGIIQKAAPEATEAIAYGMPTFRLNGNLVHFAAFKDHIGFFPTPTGINAFEAELEKYKTGKGTLRFPLDDSLIPYDFIEKVVQYRVKENLNK